ncbi:MAG: hypothetical protein EZS28_010135 [Streblomastix strix]|uniref:RRM domain-containing protein n=1 Tax=Streblomastix strix TaxID=222440 RepID=A0A5J4WH42_9EUKA|nr:MAG: hypothetical protein EZS28_010135 [Streblomastix strix]
MIVSRQVRCLSRHKDSSNGENAAIIGGISSETESDELESFLKKFGTLNYLWMEEPNGNESRQAQVFFESPEQTLSRLLEHTNSKVRIGACTIMCCILSCAYEKEEPWKVHPYYNELSKDGVIFLLNNHCLQNGDNDLMKTEAAVMLSLLVRKQELDPKMRSDLIYQLKRKITNEKESKFNDEQAIILLQGLAFVESNISEIVQGNFIETLAQLSSQSDEQTSFRSLELLLLIASNGQTEILQNVKNAINDSLIFLDLIGDSNVIFDEMIIKIEMKWNSNIEQLDSI